MWVAIRKLWFSVLVPVFTDSSFRLFASIAAECRDGSCKSCGDNWLSWQVDSKSCLCVWMVQLAQCGVRRADPGSGEHFCHWSKSVVCCLASAVLQLRWCGLAESMMIHQQLTGNRGSALLLCVCLSDFAILCGVAAATRQKKCQVRCHFQTVLLHCEPYCTVVWRVQGLKIYLAWVLGCE